MIKANCHFSELQVQTVKVPVVTILFLGSVNFPMSVISTKLNFVEVG